MKKTIEKLLIIIGIGLLIWVGYTAIQENKANYVECISSCEKDFSKVHIGDCKKECVEEYK